MKELVQYAFALISRAQRYHWGGDDPIQGFDCSGFALELLKATGVYPRTGPKLTAQQIHDHLIKAGAIPATDTGAFAFFGKDLKHITHVGFCINHTCMLHFASGDSTTTTDERAIAQNAFGRMDLIWYRKDFLASLLPHYPWVL